MASYVFYDILEPKNTFLDYIKTQSSESREIALFSKGLIHGFCPKVAILPTFFLGSKGQENVFYDILEPTNTFLGYKNKKIKKSKN